MTPIDYLDQGWSISPGAVCLRDLSGDMAVSYAELRDITLRTAGRLAALGLGRGARIAILGPNGALAYAAVLSVLRAGATWLPVNPRYATDDLLRLLADFDCDALFYDSAFCSVAAQMPGLSLRICLDRADGDVPALADWIAGAAATAPELPHDSEHLFAIQPTGGTTSRSRGVMIPARSLETTVASFTYCFPHRSRPVFLAVAPLTHAAGMVAQSILAQGGEIVILKSVDKQELLSTIQRHRITHVFLPPTVIYELLREPNVRSFDYSSLQYLIYGAAPMSPDRLMEAIEVFGPCLAQIYSQTEMAVPATFMAPADHFIDGRIAPQSRLSSCGRASAFVRVSVRDEAGLTLPDGAVGEICLAGSGRMLGYYKNPEATAEVLHGDWLRTGDLGYRDSEGFFHITDRKKDMIISGGFNIYSVEVEHALLAHPDIVECAVIGLPDPKWGEAVTAVVVLRPATATTPSEILAWSKTRIGSLKTPKALLVAPALPRSPVGKILKRQLRDSILSERAAT